jgi:hypothetical protein
MPARRLPGPGEGSPRLFENLPDHNLAREFEKGGGFPYLNGCNPLKRLDSEK